MNAAQEKTALTGPDDGNASNMDAVHDQRGVYDVLPQVSRRIAGGQNILSDCCTGSNACAADDRVRTAYGHGRNTTRRGFLTSSLAVLLSASTRSFAKTPLHPNVIGANTAISGYGLFDAIDTLKRIGFHTIEIHPMGTPDPTPGEFPGFAFDRLAEADRRRLREMLRSFEHVTTHLPYKGLSFFTSDADVARESARVFEIAMDATAYFGAELAVMHVTAPQGEDFEQAAPRIVRQCRRWADRAAAGGFKLAIETGYPPSAAQFVRLIRDIDHPNLGACIDVGHQIWYREFKDAFSGKQRGTPAGIRAYNDLIDHLIDELGEKLIHLHVHDIDPATFKEHKPIGHDVIDYPRLIAHLQRVNYTGLLVLEIGDEDMPAALRDNKQQLERFLAGD